VTALRQSSGQALREAIVLPWLLITAALLSGVQPGAQVSFVPPSVFSLVLAVLVVAALVRGGALDPSRLLHGSRSVLANANGAMVLAALVGASAGVLAMITPSAGLPRFFVSVFLLVLLVNTWVARPARVPLLRSLAVILGSGLVLKFVVLASLSDPQASTTGRVLVALFDAATFGSITQDPQPASAGYLALLAITFLLTATALLPAPPRAGLPPASGMQLPEA
jgi:hypothetical protein